MTTQRLNDHRVLWRDAGLDVNLALMDSAQVFHWHRDGNTYTGVSGGHRLTIIDEPYGITLEGCTPGDEPFWLNYFDMNRDYDRLLHSAAAHPMALQAVRLLPGLRVLRQPPWEALVAFIISANNNVPRIRLIVGRLIDNLGEDGAFPTPAALAGCGETALKALGLGYRAGYLERTAQMVLGGFDLDDLANVDYDTAHRRLLTLPGVGDKVADCVQLFSLGHSEAFPVDVWVERVMRACAPQARTKADMRAAAWAMFGRDAGLIQQSLFHCARMGLMDFDSEGDCT